MREAYRISNKHLAQQRRTRAVLILLGLLAAPLALLPASRATADVPVDDHFAAFWARTDLPVLQGNVARTWVWGPAAISDVIEESESRDGSSSSAQFFEKGRMALPSEDIRGARSEGLQTIPIVLDMVRGVPSRFSEAELELSPLTMPVAGDADSPGAPRYAGIQRLMDLDPFDESEPLVMAIDADGNLTAREDLTIHGVVAGPIDSGTGHRIASVFNDFLSSTGLVWEGEELIAEPLFTEPLVMTGRPIMEAYWVSIYIAGERHDVLLQCFEWRCMTFTPSNPKNWQVEFTNTGAHYFGWLFADHEDDEGAVSPPDEPELPVASFISEDGTPHSMRLEVAATDATRACGLMHRDSLPEDSGMLFAWEDDLIGEFWNCNTYVPLTLAWIDADGVILGYSDMRPQVRGEPQQLQTYPPPAQYRYVIEANQGWFAERGIAIGSVAHVIDAVDHGDTSSDTLCQQLGLACQ